MTSVSENTVGENQDLQKSILERIENLGLNFNKLTNITEIRLKLVNETPLRVGRVGEELKSSADLILERYPDGRIYIPGSSLKGVLRSTAERLALSSGQEICSIFSKNNECEIATKVLLGIYEIISLRIYESKNFSSIHNKLVSIIPADLTSDFINSLRSYINNINQVKSEDELLEIFNQIVNLCTNSKKPCLICRLFGSKEMASHIEVFDVTPSSPNAVKVDFRTRVAIDRFRGASRSGALFTYEYVAPHATWDGKIICYNISLLNDKREEVELLRQLFKYINIMGLQVGSMKSVGLGVIKVDVKETQVNEYSVQNFSLIKTHSYKLEEVVK